MGVVIDFEAARAHRTPPLASVPRRPEPQKSTGKLTVRALRDFPGWVEISASDAKDSVELCVKAEDVDRLLCLLREAKLQAEWLSAPKPPEPPSAA